MIQICAAICNLIPRQWTTIAEIEHLVRIEGLSEPGDQLLTLAASTASIH